MQFYAGFLIKPFPLNRTIIRLKLTHWIFHPEQQIRNLGRTFTANTMKNKPNTHRIPCTSHHHQLSTTIDNRTIQYPLYLESLTYAYELLCITQHWIHNQTQCALPTSLLVPPGAPACARPPLPATERVKRVAFLFRFRGLPRQTWPIYRSEGRRDSSFSIVTVF